MWKLINSILLIACFIFGVIEAILSGDKIDVPWGLNDFVAAPLIFGAMCILSIWLDHSFNKKSKWYVPSINMNFFVNDNPLKTPFLLGGSFLALGLGWGAGDLYQGRGLSNIAIMLPLASAGIFVAGLISVRIFSAETI